MDLNYKQKCTYQILCDEKGYATACYMITTTAIYDGKVFMVSSDAQQQIPLEKMKDIVANLKQG